MKSSAHSHTLPMTQFQIQGGGLVQGVTKLYTTFSTFLPKTKIMEIELTKNLVDSL